MTDILIFLLVLLAIVFVVTLWALICSRLILAAERRMFSRADNTDHEMIEGNPQ